MTNSNGANNNGHVRVVDYLFDQSNKGQQQQQPFRRRSADDGGVKQASHQHRLGRGRTDPPRGDHHHHHHKKKNLVQKGLAFLKDSTTSAAIRHPSTTASNHPQGEEGGGGGGARRPPSPPPSLPWSPHRRSDLIKTKFASDAEYGVQSQSSQAQQQNNNNRSDESSPQEEVPIVEECDSYESDFSGWASPLAGHDFRILPKDGASPYDSQPLPHHSHDNKDVQKLKPKLSPKRESRSERNRRMNKLKNNNKARQQHSSRRSGTSTRHHRSHHHHHHHGGRDSVVGVAGAFSRFLCGAIPTACGAVHNEHDFAACAYETDEDVDNHHDHHDTTTRRQHRLRELFQPLRNKVKQHFPAAGDNASLDHSFLTATTVSRGEGSPGDKERTLFNKYLDFVDSLGLASNSTMQDDDRTAMSSVVNNASRRYNEKSFDETNASSSVITHEERGGGGGDQEESLYSVEMAYDEKKHEKALNLFLTPTITASESSEEEAGGDGNDNGDDDNDDDKEVTASDASVLSHISEQMTIHDDEDTEQSLYGARMPSMDDHERPMVSNNNNHDGVNTEFCVVDDETFVDTIAELEILQDANASAAVKKNAFANTAEQQHKQQQQQQRHQQLRQEETVFATQQHQEPQEDQATPLFTTWDVHQEQPQDDSAITLAAPSFSNNPFVDDSIATVEEQIEAVFSTKKWMAEEDRFEEIVFSETTTMMETRGVRACGTETSLDSIVDHRFGLI